MPEAHRFGVEVQPLFAAGLAFSAVPRVPDDRKPRGGQVCAHLVVPSRRQPHAQQRRRRAPLDHLPGRLGRAAVGGRRRPARARPGGRRGRSARSRSPHRRARPRPRPDRPSRSRRRSKRRAARARPRRCARRPARRWCRCPAGGPGRPRADRAMRPRIRGSARRSRWRPCPAGPAPADATAGRPASRSRSAPRPRRPPSPPPADRPRSARAPLDPLPRARCRRSPARTRLARADLRALARQPPVDAHRAREQQPARGRDAQPRDGRGDRVIDSLPGRFGRDGARAMTDDLRRYFFLAPDLSAILSAGFGLAALSALSVLSAAFSISSDLGRRLGVRLGDRRHRLLLAGARVGRPRRRRHGAALGPLLARRHPHRVLVGHVPRRRVHDDAIALVQLGVVREPVDAREIAGVSPYRRPSFTSVSPPFAV